MRLLGIALSNIQIDGAVSWSHVTLEEMERVGASVEDCEGVANHLIGIAGVEAAAFLRELPEQNQFRLSLRSRRALDVSVIAESFGGRWAPQCKRVQYGRDAGGSDAAYCCAHA